MKKTVFAAIFALSSFIFYGTSSFAQGEPGWKSETEQVEWYKTIMADFPYYIQPDYKGTGFKPERFRREIPKPYVHPRLFFGPEDLPEIRRKLQNTESGKKILEGFKKNIDSLESDEKAKSVYQGLIEDSHDPLFEKKFAEVGYEVSVKMLWKSFMLLLTDDKIEAGKHAKALVSLTKRLHDKFKTIDLKKLPMYDVLSNLPEIVKKRIPGTKDYQSYWGDIYFGTVSLQYDFLYNWLDDSQRKTMREFIADTTGGIWTHGMGCQRTGGNWGSCHWAGPLQHMAIEGETGYDPKVYEAWKEIFTSFHTYDFSEQGSTFEPLGKGSLGSKYLPYFARRGLDAAAYPHEPRTISSAMLFGKQPFADKFRTGGGLGSSMGTVDTWDALAMKHLYPENPLIEYIYRGLVGENYEFFSERWSTHFSGLMNPIFGALCIEDFDKAKSREVLLKAGNPPLTYFDPQTALMISRSDWTENALWVHFIANTALAQGHLANESGTFTFSANGRVWGDYVGPNTGGPLGNFVEARFFSLVNIDRLGQTNMPAKMVAYSENPLASFATCDMKNAWDWKHVDPKRAGPEKVLNNETYADSTPLYKPMIKGYSMPGRMLEHWRNPGQRSMEGDYKAPHLPVKYARRSVGLVRGAFPYLVIADDFARNDTNEHLYEWYMQLPFDVDIQKTDEGRIILNEKEGPRRLLVQTFYSAKNNSAEQPSVEMMAGYGLNEGGNTSRRIHCYRLRVPFLGNSLSSRVVLYPFKEEGTLPEFQWDPVRENLKVRVGDQSDELNFAKPGNGAKILSLKRGSASLELVEGEERK